IFKLDFGMESENPIKRLNVYSKRDLKKAMPPDPKNYSRIFDPKEFRELIFRIYSRSRDKNICEQLNEASKKIAESKLNGFL
ncbi:deoxynucleoside triphosphate triphosphohydrolase SAMHD1 isoform X2, partial [Biomphalaria glabrata]